MLLHKLNFDRGKMVGCKSKILISNTDTKIYPNKDMNKNSIEQRV